MAGYLKMNFDRDCNIKEIQENKRRPKAYTHTNRRKVESYQSNPEIRINSWNSIIGTPQYRRGEEIE